MERRGLNTNHPFTQYAEMGDFFLNHDASCKTTETGVKITTWE